MGTAGRAGGDFVPVVLVLLIVLVLETESARDWPCRVRDEPNFFFPKSNYERDQEHEAREWGTRWLVRRQGRRKRIYGNYGNGIFSARNCPG